MSQEKLLIIGTLPSEGTKCTRGQHRVTISFAKYLPIPNTLITIKKTDNFIAKMFSLKIKNRSLRNREYYEVSLLKMILFLFKYNKVFITAGSKVGLLAGIIKKIRRRRLNIIFRTGGFIYLERKIAKDSHETGRNHLNNVLIEKFVFQNVDKIIANSDYYKSLLIKIYPFTKHKTFVVNNGIDDEFFQYKITAKNTINDKITLLSVVDLYRKKGFDYLIKVLKEVNVNKKIELIIVGNRLETNKNFIEEYVKNNQKYFVNKKIVFKSRLSTEELVYYYKNSNLYLQFSRLDEGPSSVIEAYYFGLPMLLSKNVGTHPDIYAWKYCFIEELDINKLAKKLTILVEQLNCSQPVISTNNSFINWKNILKKDVFSMNGYEEFLRPNEP